MGDGQRRPPAGQLVLVVVVDRSQAGGVQFAQGGRDGGRPDRAAASGGESGGELVEGLRSAVAAVAEDRQDAPSGRSERGRRVRQLGEGVVPHSAWLQWRDDLSDAQNWKHHGAVEVGR
jgi:hypothetical protein